MNLPIRVASVATLMLAVLAGCTSVSAAPVPTTPAATSVTTSAAPSTPATTSPSATAKPSASATATASPTAEFTPTWGPTEDCTGATPVPKYAAQCAVKGKSQAQVWQACQAAAKGALWDSSSNAPTRLGAKDPNLDQDMAICGKGAGLKAGGMLWVFGYPAFQKGKPVPNTLQYFLIRGDTNPGGDVVFFPFFVNGKLMGYPAEEEGQRDSSSLVNKILDFNAALAHGV